MSILDRVLRGTLTLNAFWILGLLWCAFAILAFGLQDSLREFNAVAMIELAAMGLLVGLGLARAPVPAWLATIISLSIGVEIIVIRTAQLTGRLVALGQAIAGVVIQIWNLPRRATLNLSPMMNAVNEIWNVVTVLFLRLADWLTSVVRGIPAFDPVAVTLTWSIIVWAMVFWASWHTFRRMRAFTALVPCVALLAAVLAFTMVNPGFLVLLLAVMLLLCVVVSRGERERFWQLNHIDMAQDLPLDLMVAAAPLTLLIVLLAASVPSISIDDLVRFSQDVVPQRSAIDRLPESFGLEVRFPTRQPTIFDSVRAPGLPRQHLIGAGAELSRQVVMTVRTDDTFIESPADFVAPLHYWRGSTYDRYTGRGWITSDTNIIDYPADALLDVDVLLPGQMVTQNVQIARDAGGLLFATSVLVTVDRDFRVAWRADGDAFSAEIRANSYRAQSWVSSFDEVQLRAAGTAYPDWVRARYLDLPADIPPRVLALALDLTATQRTPYDRVRAIENYLRAFPYTLDLPAPPPNRDIVEYFVFDLQKGYCDYFASAMVVLARAAGVPARLVVGYAPGSFDAVNGRYIITEADAHAWVEIFFPGAGWVEFEPTSNHPALQYSSRETSPPSQLPKADEFLVSTRLNVGVEWQMIAGVVVGMIGLVVAGILTWDAVRWRRLAPVAVVEEIFARLVWYAARLGVPVRASDTPNEFAEKISARLAHIQQDARGLVELYVQLRYGRRVIDQQMGKDALQRWLRVRRVLWGRWARKRITSEG